MLDHVDYDALDRAKGAFIRASKQTLTFAEKFGFVPDGRLGASANVFSLDLEPFIAAGAKRLHITLLPEGLGTADDARPDDLSEGELVEFWHNIGVKTVACLTNDAASSGMQTILISLYLPSANPELVFDVPFLSGFLDGFVSGCAEVGCVWISGETPQLKGKICQSKLDIAGALFGLMPPGMVPIDGTELGPGNKIVFVESSGPHENGFTSLRKLAGELPGGYRTVLSDGRQFWQAINSPSILYTRFVQRLLGAGVAVTSIENVTGHGWQKLMRSRKPLSYVIHDMLPIPEIFRFVASATGVATADMLKIFNCGVGCAVYVESEEDARQTVVLAREVGLRAVVAGDVRPCDEREVVIEPLSLRLLDSSFALSRD